MRFVQIKFLHDGVLTPVCQVYEDGRFQGDPEMKQEIEGLSLLDPQTGKRAQDGEGILRALMGVYANRTMTTAVIGNEESPGQGNDEQPRPESASARPPAGAGPRPQPQPRAAGRNQHQRAGR